MAFAATTTGNGLQGAGKSPHVAGQGYGASGAAKGSNCPSSAKNRILRAWRHTPAFENAGHLSFPEKSSHTAGTK